MVSTTDSDLFRAGGIEVIMYRLLLKKKGICIDCQRKEIGWFVLILSTNAEIFQHL